MIVYLHSKDEWEANTFKTRTSINIYDYIMLAALVASVGSIMSWLLRITESSEPEGTTSLTEGGTASLDTRGTASETFTGDVFCIKKKNWKMYIFVIPIELKQVMIVQVQTSEYIHCMQVNWMHMCSEIVCIHTKYVYWVNTEPYLVSTDT